MVVVDSSVLIPLARVGRLDLLHRTFDSLDTTDLVRQELVVPGMPGAAALQAFLEDTMMVNPPDEGAQEVATLEGLALADASLVLLAERLGTPLLSNDRGLVRVAQAHGVTTWWLTTLLLHAAKQGIVAGPDAKTLLLELMGAGMNLDARVYAQVQRKLENLGT